MKVVVIMDVSRDDEGRQARGEDIINEAENEISALSFDVDGGVYGVEILGIGKTVKEAEESKKLRDTGRKS